MRVGQRKIRQGHFFGRGLRGLLILLLVVVVLHGLRAAIPGLPFTEDFSDAALRDDSQTSAEWSIIDQALRLGGRDRRYGSFAAGAPGVPVTSDIFMSRSIAAGDVDGDGDSDFVIANFSAPNRLYLNNGTIDPWNGVTGSDISLDADVTTEVVLGDVDGDGDLDMVAGNAGQVNRLYLSNGSSNPWNGVTGSDITSDADSSRAIALGDIDGDGDLDLVAGNFNQPNRLYLNNGTADPWNGVVGSDISPDAAGTLDVALGDVDGDGDLDLVTAEFNPPQKLYLNNGTADPWNGVAGIDITFDAIAARVVTLGDVDNDADIDLVVGNFAQPNRLYLNNGTLDPWDGVSGSDITADAEETVGIVLGDVDGDGDLDLIAGNHGQANRLYLNRGDTDPWSGVSGVDISPETDDTWGVLLEDVDGDGDLDLVGANSGGAPSMLYPNEGTANPWNGAVKSNITSDSVHTFDVALGDVDDDGDLDMVAGNAGRDRLYLNNGTADPWSGVTGRDITLDAYDARAIVLGDVDSDGDLDLVVANADQPRRLYLNNGTDDPWNGVTGKSISTDEDWATSAVLGDVDNDGDLDLVVGNDSSGLLKLYSNNGTADPWNGVSATGFIDVPANNTALALGDVDGDGDLDLVVGNQDTTNWLYLNNGTPWSGVFPIDITSDAQSTESLALGDVDADGDLDLVVGNYAQPNRLYLNNGTVDPWTGVTGVDITTDAYYTRSVALGDVDDDGDLDLVSGDVSDGNKVYLNNGSADPWQGAVGQNLPVSAGLQVAIALGDVDGDGDLDLVDGQLQNVNRLFPNGGGSWPASFNSKADITVDVRFTHAATAGDVDGDGDLDIVTGNLNQSNRLYPNGGEEEPFNGVSGADISADSNLTHAVVLGDVDGDADLDLVVGNYGQANVLYLNNGTANPWNGAAGSNITADGHDTETMTFGDVDGDGDLDLVAGNVDQANRLYLNNGTSDPWNGVAGSDVTLDAHSTTSLALEDVDGDGDLDLVVGNVHQPNRLYLNDGTADPWSGASGSDITGDTGDTFDIALGDVDGDGDLDLVAGNTFEPNRLYLNNGTADPWNGVVGADITSDADVTYAVSLHDVDGDGDLDLVAGNYNEPNRLYLNNDTADPWDGVSGLDITADADSTLASIVEDLNGDGLVEIVAVNFGQPLRLYRTALHHHARGRATSLAVDTEPGPVTNATLAATSMLPPNTSVDFWLSNNGGNHWFKIRPGQDFIIPTPGSDLRWRAEMRTLSPLLTPRIDQIDITSGFIPLEVGDRVWEDLDGDGIQDAGEPGLDSVVVVLLDAGGAILQLEVTDTNGNFTLPNVPWAEPVSVRFFPPTGFVLAPQDQGADDSLDSDADAVTGDTPVFTFLGGVHHTQWDAGMIRVLGCLPPDEPVFLSNVTMTTDGNDYPILHFMDPNQPTQITGYNVYRTSDPGMPKSSWPLEASDVIDMDEATPNKQWIDTSGDVSPTGLWTYTVTAYNNRCPAEGPF